MFHPAAAAYHGVRCQGMLLSHADTASRAWVSAPTVLAAAALITSFAAFGVLEGLAAGNPQASFFLSTLHYASIATIPFAWASHDAKQYGQVVSGAMIVCLVVFGFAAVPFYFASYRPAAGWGWWLGKGVFVLAACIMSFMAMFNLAAG